MYQSNSPQPDSPRALQKPLPTMYDLPSEYPEDPGLPDEFHEFQPQLLRETCQINTHPVDRILIGTDLNIHYDSRQPHWYKRPDWFLVLGVPKAKQQEDLRWSYVIWQEMVSPFLVIELLSPGTEAEDLGQTLREVSQPPGKWEVYEQILRVPYYAVFDRYKNRFRLFQLMTTRYQEVSIIDNRYWFEELNLGLGVWQGEYQEADGQWLRWYDANDCWIPTSAELAEQEKQRAEQEKQRAEQEKQRADRLAERLRELGIDPDQL
ncbi:MAG: Uma2 family endonuclease [Cyanobacteria bacterium P01_D01_bin.44]